MASVVFKTPPPPLPVPVEQVLVSSAALNADEKKRVWEHIKLYDQPLLAFLSDPQVTRVVRELGGVMQFEPALIEAALGSTALARLLGAPRRASKEQVSMQGLATSAHA